MLRTWLNRAIRLPDEAQADADGYVLYKTSLWEELHVDRSGRNRPWFTCNLPKRYGGLDLPFPECQKRAVTDDGIEVFYFCSKTFVGMEPTIDSGCQNSDLGVASRLCRKGKD